MKGLGDNIYQRAIVKKLDARIYLTTPWPELYADLTHVLPIYEETNLRTQAKNAAQYSEWAEIPQDIAFERKFSYARALSVGRTILQGLEESIEVDIGPSIDMDVPRFNEHRIKNKEPLAIIRPVTVRREWQNEARNPSPEYLQTASRVLKEHGYYIVAIADIADSEEWLEGDIVADKKFYHGELGIEEIIALTFDADVFVSGIGFPVPLCMATKTPAVIIGGGCGAYNHPTLIEDERIGATNMQYILPDDFCMCTQHKHDCDKTITDFVGKVEKILEGFSINHHAIRRKDARLAS
jgi:ADP-heptose:LPS heptosyltransferase